MESMNDRVDAWIQSMQIMKRFGKLMITGCPKSGTTWLVRSLDGHPQIIANGEGRFAWRLFPFLQHAITTFNSDQRSNNCSPLGMVTNAEILLHMRALADNVLMRYLGASKKNPNQVKVIADKTPQHVLSTDLLRMVYPDVKFINIIRDPRDAATSALFHFNKTGQKPKDDYVRSFICDTWRLHVAAALAAEKQMGPAHFMNIRYEDFHANDRGILQLVLQFLGVDASDAMVASCAEAGSFKKLSGGRDRGQGDQNAFFRKGQIGDWRNHLDPELARHCCLQVQELMTACGYTIDPVVEAKVFVKSQEQSHAA